VRIAARNFAVLAAALLAAGVTAGRAAEVATGSGVVIGANGEVLTNAHVVKECRSIKLTFANGTPQPAELIARDEQNDVAVVQTKRKHNPAAVAAFREGPPLRPGDAIIALGYPLTGVLATGANLTVGNVSALAGIGDDSRFIQMSAPVQPGNSGGPLVDTSGHVVGIVTAKLDALRVARAIGDVPQNVNFALKAQVARTFLDSKLISYKTETSNGHLSAADVGEIARPFTVYIACTRLEEHVAVASSPPASASKPAPPAPESSASGGYLKGPLREAFVKKATTRCTRKADKDNPDVPRPTIRAFCACLAEGEADTITEADFAKANDHKANPDFVDRLNKVAAACKKKLASL
jgi:S1-C subfamily serine protease